MAQSNRRSREPAIPTRIGRRICDHYEDQKDRTNTQYLNERETSSFLTFNFVGHLPSVQDAHKTAIGGHFCKGEVVDGPGDVVSILPFEGRSCDEDKDESCLLEN